MDNCVISLNETSKVSFFFSKRAEREKKRTRFCMYVILFVMFLFHLYIYIYIQLQKFNQVKSGQVRPNHMKRLQNPFFHLTWFRFVCVVGVFVGLCACLVFVSFCCRHVWNSLHIMEDGTIVGGGRGRFVTKSIPVSDEKGDWSGRAPNKKDKNGREEKTGYQYVSIEDGI